jgi:Ca-activated chloride channel homolog
MIPLCLALALDVSASVSEASWRMQRDATAEAVLTAPVLRASRVGMSLTVVAFGTEAEVVIQPTRDPYALANGLAAVQRPDLGGSTNVAAAIATATAALLAQDCERRVIDVSGDGAHNASAVRYLHDAVSTAVAAGVEINALPIITAHEPAIADWYAENVTGPAGGFVIPADSTTFALAIRQKLSAEVAAR